MQGASASDDDSRADAVFSRLPLRRRPASGVGLRVDPGDHGLPIEAKGLAAGDDLHARPFSRRQLHTVRPLLRLVGTAEIAQAGTLAALHVHRELLDPVPEMTAALHEQLVVLVDQLLFQVVDVVLLHELPGTTLDLFEAEPGDVPALDDTFRRDERRAGVDGGRAAVARADGQGQRAAGGEQAAALLVESLGHFDLAA